MIYEVLIGDNGVVCTCSFETLSQSMKDWLVDNSVCAKCHDKIDNQEPCCQCSQNSSVLINNSLRNQFEEIWSDDKKRERNQKSKQSRKVRENKAEGLFKEEDIQAIYALQEGNCFYCKRELLDQKKNKSFEIEHIIPLSDGGTNWPSNLSLSCKKCNQKKGTKGTDVFWKIIRKEYGNAFASVSKKENKKNQKAKAELTLKRQMELKKSYIFDDSPFAKIQNILDLENVKTTSLQEANFRHSFFDLLVLIINKISLDAFGKKLSRLNKAEKLSVLIAMFLTIESIHNFLELDYSQLNDFHKRFEFDGLFEDENMPLKPSPFDRKSGYIYDFAFEEAEKDIKEFLEYKKCLMTYLEREGWQGFKDVSEAFLKIHQFYLENN